MAVLVERLYTWGMAVVCIAREYGALAEECSEELARMMGARLITREIVLKKLEEAGVGESAIARFDEKRPSFFASLSEQRDSYLHFLKTVLIREAAAGPCVLVGRGCVPLFSAVPSALAVRFIAPMETRVKRIAAHHQVDERRAKQLIDHQDNDRRGFYRYFFGADWDDPGIYDLIVNTGKVALSDCASLILRALELAVTPEREAAGKEALEGAMLSQEVVTRILFQERLQVHFLEAKCRGGECLLSGVASAAATSERCAAVAGGTPGVEKVRNEIQLVREYAVLP